MNTAEFLALMKSRGAKIVPAKNINSITLLNTKLQQARVSMLPKFLLDLYQETSGITMSSACIFGPEEIERGTKFPVPSILDINKELVENKNLFGKIVFGRNDLFWFATDALDGPRWSRCPAALHLPHLRRALSPAALT
ncbi:MAG: hypothetical protein IJV03_00755 [Alphaproteobacteria bacterium]|nr:hypothetical protein [Alphaproteobacteria bacterium]